MEDAQRIRLRSRFAGRQYARCLTGANWRSAYRYRVRIGIRMPVVVEALEDGRFRTTFGAPPDFGAERTWDGLDEALAYANEDSKGIVRWIGVSFT